MLENQAEVWDACAGEGWLDSTREAFLGVLQMRRFDIQPVNPDA